MVAFVGSNVRSLARKILDQLNTFPAVGFDFPPSGSEIQQLEGLLEGPVDPQILELLKLGNGETLKSPGIFYGMRTLSLEEMTALLFGGQTPAGWLPFARDQEGRLLGVEEDPDGNGTGSISAVLAAGSRPVHIADSMTDLLTSVIASLERREGYPEVLKIPNHDAWSAPLIFGMNIGSGRPEPFLAVLKQLTFPLGSGGSFGATVQPQNPSLPSSPTQIGEVGLVSVLAPIGDDQDITEHPIGQVDEIAAHPIGEDIPITGSTQNVTSVAAAAASIIGAAAAAGASSVAAAAQDPNALVPEPAPSIAPISAIPEATVAATPAAQPVVENMKLEVADAGILASLTRLPGLKKLDLPDLTPFLDNLSSLGELSQLKELSVESAYQPVLNELMRLKNLQSLTVRNSLFYALNYLKSIPGLQKLTFVDSTIQNAAALGELKNLHTLNLQNTVVEKGFEAIVNNPSIQHFTGDAEQMRLFNQARRR